MQKSKGFTLWELVIVMLIVGILATIGTSSFRYVTTSNRISSKINGLLGDMQFARSQAAKTGSFVSVCPAANVNLNSCANSNTWTNGWIVFLDLNGNGVIDNATDLVIRTQPSIAPDTLVGTANFKYVVFNREGYGSNGLNGWATISLNSSPAIAQWQRCLAVSAVGAMLIEKSGASTPAAC